MAERFFFIRHNGRTDGPFTAAKLAAMSRRLQILPDDDISPDKISWIKAADIQWLDFPECELNPNPPEQKNTEPEKEEENQLEIEIKEPMQNIEDKPATEQPCMVRIIGDALSLLWNTTDNLPRLMTPATGPAAVLTILFFTSFLMLGGSIVFIVIHTAFSPIKLFGGLFVLYFSFIAGTFIMSFIIRILFSPGGQGCILHDMLTTAMVMIDLLPVFLLILLFGFSAAGMPGTFFGRITFMVLTMISLFELFNLAAGIRMLFVKNCGMRPRHAVWIGSFLTWCCIMYLWIFLELLIRFSK